MKVYFANLNPCNTRKVNIRQYIDFVKQCRHEIVTNREEADIIFVWGCEFRSDWRDFSFSVTREIKERNTAKVVYIGCTFDEKFKSKIRTELGLEVIPWRDRNKAFETMLTESRLRIEDIPIKLVENRLVNSAAEHRKNNPLDNFSFEDEYVKLNICEGCTHNCSYCSERHMFPDFRSFLEDDLIDQCEKACRESGTKKVMFLADSSGEYGIDTGSSLPQLIIRLKERIGDRIKIGISQLNPEHFIRHSRKMMNLIKSGNIIYLNIPIQSASDTILRSMRRNYDIAQVDKIFNDFKRFGFVNFSTHLLFGFPGEKETHVDKSIAFAVAHSPSHVVASAFMPHPAIDATTFKDQIDPDVVERRLKRCEEELIKNGIKVATDWGALTNRFMNRIRYSLNLDLIKYGSQNYKHTIVGRKHADGIKRIRQEYITRLDKIRLGMNEYVPVMPNELFAKIMNGFNAEMASAYPEVNQAYEALSDFLSVPRERILLTSGADMAIKITLETFCDPGSTVATISPTFAMYGIHTSLLACKLEELYCDKTGACTDADLLSLVKPGTKCVIIANPNGVTGFVFPVATIKKLAEKAIEQGTLVVIDETYADFSGINTASLIDNFSNLIIIRSFSKNIGMAGLRIGYILTSEHLAGMIEKFKPMMEINALAVKAIKAICSDKRYLHDAVGRIVDARKKFAGAMTELGFDCIVRSGNFILVDFGEKQDIICRSLDAHKVEYRRLSAPLKSYIRITIGTEDIMDRVADIITAQAAQ